MASGPSGKGEQITGNQSISGSGSVDERLTGEAGIPMRVYSSESLFGPEREIAISHAGIYYRLRITRQGKLILNK